MCVLCSLHINSEREKFTDLFTGSIGNVTKDIGYLSAIGTKTSISVHMRIYYNTDTQNTRLMSLIFLSFSFGWSSQQLNSSLSLSVFLLLRSFATTIGYGSLSFWVAPSTDFLLSFLPPLTISVSFAYQPRTHTCATHRLRRLHRNSVYLAHDSCWL